MSCTSVTWASYRSCDKCDLKWLSNDSIRQLKESNQSIKQLFEAESQREAELIQSVDDSISLEHNSEHDDNNRKKVNGAFRIPNCVIHNNVSIINLRAATRILQNMDLIDDDTDIVTTYKTVRIVGKQMNGQDNYVHTQETTTQMWKRWIINPHCQYKLYFDLIIVIMVMTSSLTVPYRMGFGLPPTLDWDVIYGITEVFFCMDLALSFFTAFEYKDGTLETSFKNIASVYLRTWFVIDFLSAVPLYRIAMGGSSLGVLVRLLKILKVGRLLRLYKVFKSGIMKILDISKHDFIPNELIAIQNSFGLLIKMMGFLGFTTHIVACIFSWISVDSKGPTWSSEIEDIDGTFKRYIAALYWTFATMSTVGKNNENEKYSLEI